MENRGIKIESKGFFFRGDYRFRILIIKLDHLGDLLLAIPALMRLKDKFKNSIMDIIVGKWNLELSQEIGLFRNIFLYDFYSTDQLKTSKRDFEVENSLKRTLPTYDIAIDFRINADTRFLLRQINSKLRIGYRTHSEYDMDLDISLDAEIEEPHIIKPQNRLNRAIQLLKLVEAIPVETIKLPMLNDFNNKEPERNTVGIFPGASSSIASVKQWPIENYAKLVKKLYDFDNKYLFNIYFSYSEKENVSFFSNIPNVTLHIGLSIPELMNSLSKNVIGIANNSFGAHLFSYFGIPVIAIYSAHETIDEWYPPFGQTTIIYSDVSCSPCHIADISKCTQDLTCLKQISVEVVLKKVLEILERDSPRNQSEFLTYIKRSDVYSED